MPENLLPTLQLSQVSCVGKKYTSINLYVSLLHTFYFHEFLLYLFCLILYVLCVIYFWIRHTLGDLEYPEK